VKRRGGKCFKGGGGKGEENENVIKGCHFAFSFGSKSQKKDGSAH